MSDSAIIDRPGSSLVGYSEEEKEQTIRAFLGPAGLEGEPRCSLCGEEFEIKIVYEASRQGEIEVCCPGCANGFKWRQRNRRGSWSDLHVLYFLERLKESATEIRCPFDDCFISYVEHSDGRVEFRCPYCNRRSTADLEGGEQSPEGNCLTATFERKYSDFNNLGDS